MKTHEKEVSNGLEQLFEDGSDAGHWLGYSQKHGWLLLDRSIEGNEPGIGGNSTLRFIRLADWRIVAVPRRNWHDGSISYYPGVATSEDREKLQTLLLEWRKRRSDWVFKRSWQEVSRLIFQRDTPTSIEPPVETKEDVMLCFMWSNMRPSSELGVDRLLFKLKESIGAHDVNRLISARLAERSAADYYRGLGKIVRDISIEQLLERSCNDWLDFDLDVGYPVDVKNSRATYNGHEHYSEHAIAQFKQNRAYGGEVRIAGVRSPYYPNNETPPTKEVRSEVTVLGEVSELEIKKLVAWTVEKFGDYLSINLWYPKRIPGWLFEYPETHYNRRKNAVELMQKLIQEGGHKHLTPGQSLIAETLGVELPHPFGSEPLLAELRSLVKICGLAKRCLIVYAMGATLRAVMRGEDTAALIANLKEATNVRHGVQSKLEPWGLDDPLGFVDRFLSAFITIGNGIKPYVSHIRIFRLKGPEVLVAEMKDGSSRTILAYCGGWIKSKGRCGNTPLVVGNHKHCNECNHLICCKCEFCSSTCESGLKRNSQRLAQKSRNCWDAYTEIDDDELE